MFGREEVQEAARDLRCMLELERRPVGVKFLFDSEEYSRAAAKGLKAKLPYCVLVKTAMAGNGLKAAAEHFGCGGGARALGMVELEEVSRSGRFYHRLGLYQDLPTSKHVQQNMSFCSHRPYGVMVKPVEEYEEAPDVVLVIVNPYNAMRIVQGYSYAFGFNTSLKMSGNQAVCSECTAFPFESNDINVSVLCSGTRYKAKWRDDELVIGFPHNQLLPIVRGIHATLDATEPDEKKRAIEARCRAAGRSVPSLHYGRNYWTGLNPRR